MAKVKNNRYNGYITLRPRVVKTNTTQRVRPIVKTYKPKLDLKELSDQRTFDFNDQTQPTKANVTFNTDALDMSFRGSLKKLSLCARRTTRKRVLHAYKKAGKLGQNKPKWTADSLIKCKGKNK